MNLNRPGLVIALGGTGKEVVYNLRKRFQMAYGTPDPPNMRYLFIDTDMRDNEALEKFRDNAYPLRVPIQKMVDLQQPDSPTSATLRMKDWFDPILRQNITAQNFEGGVKGVRMMGRLSLLATSNLHELRSRILKDILALRTDTTGNDAGSMLVFVVASGGGGTGSGTFIDFGYLLTNAIRRSNISPGICETEGIAAIASVGLTDWPSQMRNSVALVQELDHFCKAENIFQAQYGEESLPPDIGKQAPYDLITLVSPRQLENNLAENARDAMAILEKKISDYLFMRLTSKGGRNAFGARIHDMQQNFSSLPADNHGYPNRYTTFGIGLRQFPIGLCINIAQRQIIQKLIQFWLKPSEIDTPALNQRFLKEDEDLTVLFEADLQTLRDIVGLRLPPDIAAEKEWATNKDPLYKELIQTDSESLEAVLRNVTRSSTESDLTNQFPSPIPTKYLAPQTPGYIAGTIERNKEDLIAKSGQRVVKHRVRLHLLPLVFDQSKGPRYALSLAIALDKEMSADHALMAKVLKNAGTGVPQKTTKVEVEEEEVEEKPPVDPLIPFHKAKPKVVKEVVTISNDNLLEKAYRANNLYERCLVSARLQIYDDVLRDLRTGEESLYSQVANFIDYVEQWNYAASRNDASDQRLIRDLFSDNVFDAEWVSRQLDQLQNDISLHSLADLQHRMNNGNFRAGLPRRANGDVDFSLFDPLKSKIETQLRNEDNIGRQQAVNISVLRMLSHTERGRELENPENLSKICADLAREGRPLLSLQLGTPGYAELLSSFSTSTFVWQSLAHRANDVELYETFQEGMKIATAEFAETLSANPCASPAEHDDPGVVANLFVRGAFPSHVISGYEIAGRRSILFPPNAQNQTTPFTQRSITLILPPNVIEKAKTLLLISEALASRPKKGWTEGVNISWDGAQHTLMYTINRNDGARQISYPNRDIQRAALALAQHEHTILYLETRLNEIGDATRNYNDAYVKKTIIGHSKALQELINSGQSTGYYDDLDLGGLVFEDAIERFSEWLLGHYTDLNAEDITAMHIWARWDSERETWRCKTCNAVQGRVRPLFKAPCNNVECSSHQIRATQLTR